MENQKIDNNLVYLVNAGNDPGMSAIANDHSFPPLGVLALGTWLRHRMPDIEVIARDGGVHTQERVLADIQRLKPGLVGVSVLSTSYKNSLEIAQASKDSGAKVVFGNDQASHLAPQILANRPYVDFVIGSEYGEESLEMLVRYLSGEDISPADIPHLAFKKEGQIFGFDYEKDRASLSILRSRLNPSGKRADSLDVFPLTDRKLYPKDHWESYLSSYRNKFANLHSKPVTGVSTMNRARGCSRQGKDICKHCDMLLDISFSSPEMFWAEAKSAYEQVGANVLYEVCDSFSSFGKFIDGVVSKKPSNLEFEPQFFVYCQARDLTRKPELASKLKDIGVFRVNIGLESGSDPTLKHMKGPEDSVRNNYLALRLMKSQGIHTYGSLVLGTDAETSETLRETVDWAKKIIDERLVADIEVQPILPLPNNYYGKKLAGKGFFPHERNTDWPLDTDLVSQTYVDRFSGVSYRDVVEAAKEVRLHAKESGINYGSGVSREETYK